MNDFTSRPIHYKKTQQNDLPLPYDWCLELSDGNDDKPIQYVPYLGWVYFTARNIHIRDDHKFDTNNDDSYLKSPSLYPSTDQVSEYSYRKSIIADLRSGLIKSRDESSHVVDYSFLGLKNPIRDFTLEIHSMESILEDDEQRRKLFSEDKVMADRMDKSPKKIYEISAYHASDNSKSFPSTIFISVVLPDNKYDDLKNMILNRRITDLTVALKNVYGLYTPRSWSPEIAEFIQVLSSESEQIVYDNGEEMEFRRRLGLVSELCLTPRARVDLNI